MDEKIVESVKVVMFAADRGGASEEGVARAAIDAYTAALAEAGLKILAREPTQIMMQQGYASTAKSSVRETWHYMWDAAPATPDQR